MQLRAVVVIVLALTVRSARRQDVMHRNPGWIVLCGVFAVATLLRPGPAGATDFFWTSPSGGVFTSPVLWNPSMSAPGGMLDTVNFDLGSHIRYTVEGVRGENSRLLVHDDTLTLSVIGGFSGEGYSLVGTSNSSPGFTVGAADGEFGDVTLVSGSDDAILHSEQAGIAFAANSTGVVTVDGLNWTNFELRVGVFGTGTLNIHSGGDVSATDAFLGFDIVGKGTANVSGDASVLRATGNLFVGFRGMGEASISGGADVFSDDIYIGFITDSIGSVSVSGLGSTLSADSQLIVANSGSGELTIEDGAVVSSTSGLIGDSTTATGTVTVTGQGSQWNNSGDLVVGVITDNVKLTIANGGEVVVGGLLTALGSNTIVLDNGKLTVNQLSTSALAALDWQAGTLRLTNDAGLTIGPGELLFGGTLFLDHLKNLEIDHTLTIDNGGTLFADNGVKAGILNVVGGGQAFVGGGLIAGSAQIAPNGQLLVHGPDQDFGTGLTNQGHVVFQNSTIVDGPVTNAPGGAITALGDITFNGAVAGPGGFFGPGTITFAGGLAPGASPAVVPFEGSVVFDSANQLQIELGGVAAGEFDRLEIDGDATLDGTLVLSLLAPYAPSPGDTFEILAVQGMLSGQFAGLSDGSVVRTVTGEPFQIAYSSGSVTLTAVPEPAAIVLCTLALCAACAGHRRW